MAHHQVQAVIHTAPGSPGIQARRSNFEDNGIPPPDSMMVRDLERDIGPGPGGVFTDNTGG